MSNVVFCGDKSIVAADYMIDDDVRHFRRFRGEGILFTAPHNVHETEFRRVDNWRQIREIFLNVTVVYRSSIDPANLIACLQHSLHDPLTDRGRFLARQRVVQRACFEMIRDALLAFGKRSALVLANKFDADQVFACEAPRAAASILQPEFSASATTERSKPLVGYFRSGV